VNTEEYGCMRTVEDSHWWYGGLHALVLDACERHAPKPALVADIGCGTGGMAAQLDPALRVIGLDLAQEALVFCQERGMDQLARADAGHLPLSDDAADVALLLDVLYHSDVANRGQVLEEVGRILRPGGLMLINVPAYQWLYSSHDVAVHTARRFTRGEINGLLREAGFEIVSSSYWNSLLLPAIVAFRLVLRWLPDRGSDLNPDTPRWVNRLLGAVLRVERRWMRLASLPAGLSIFVVARAPKV
jgi:SAM-dependent methyltransferase